MALPACPFGHALKHYEPRRKKWAWKPEVRDQRSEIRGRKSEVRSRRPEARKSGVVLSCRLCCTNPLRERGYSAWRCSGVMHADNIVRTFGDDGCSFARQRNWTSIARLMSLPCSFFEP